MKSLEETHPFPAMPYRLSTMGSVLVSDLIKDYDVYGLPTPIDGDPSLPYRNKGL